VLGVFGLNFQTEERDLRRAFEKYGKLDKVKLVTDPRTLSRFALIYYSTVEEAEFAKERVREVDGRLVTVSDIEDAKNDVDSLSPITIISGMAIDD
jgi:RNA recognition motif-containing protein